MKRRDSVVVVGAGVAGVGVAAALREHGHAGSITLVSGESSLPYDRPPLSKAALIDEPAPHPELLQPEAFYTDHAVTLRLSTRVSGLEPAQGSVALESGERIRADAVVLTTGGTPRTLAVPGSDLAGVCTLRTAEDAARIREYLQHGGPVVVVGGGFIGTEVAAAATRWDCPVTVVEAGQLPMLQALGHDVATRLVDAHRADGVRVRTGVGVHRFLGDTAVRHVQLTDGSTLPAALVVTGIGMSPNTALARKAGLAVGDGIHVESTGQSSNPAIWAAGDVAAVHQPDGTRRRSEHWQQARQQADRVAPAILGIPTPDTPVPWFWSDQNELNIQVAGQPDTHDARVCRGAPEDLTFSMLTHRDGVLTGIIAINRGKDVRPAIELIRNGTVLDNDQLTDQHTTLKSLAKTAR